MMAEADKVPRWSAHVNATSSRVASFLLKVPGRTLVERLSDVGNAHDGDEAVYQRGPEPPPSLALGLEEATRRGGPTLLV